MKKLLRCGCLLFAFVSSLGWANNNSTAVSGVGSSSRGKSAQAMTSLAVLLGSMQLHDGKGHKVIGPANGALEPRTHKQPLKKDLVSMSRVKKTTHEVGRYSDKKESKPSHGKLSKHKLTVLEEPDATGPYLSLMEKKSTQGSRKSKPLTPLTPLSAETLLYGDELYGSERPGVRQEGKIEKAALVEMEGKATGSGGKPGFFIENMVFPHLQLHAPEVALVNAAMNIAFQRSQGNKNDLILLQMLAGAYRALGYQGNFHMEDFKVHYDLLGESKGRGKQRTKGPAEYHSKRGAKTVYTRTSTLFIYAPNLDDLGIISSFSGTTATSSTGGVTTTTTTSTSTTTVLSQVVNLQFTGTTTTTTTSDGGTTTTTTTSSAEGLGGHPCSTSTSTSASGGAVTATATMTGGFPLPLPGLSTCIF